MTCRGDLGSAYGGLRRGLRFTARPPASRLPERALAGARGRRRRRRWSTSVPAASRPLGRRPARSAAIGGGRVGGRHLLRVALILRRRRLARRGPGPAGGRGIGGAARRCPACAGLVPRRMELLRPARLRLGSARETIAASVIRRRPHRELLPPDPDAGEERRDDAVSSTTKATAPAGWSARSRSSSARAIRSIPRLAASLSPSGIYSLCTEFGKNDFIRSIGSGKMIVEFFSAAISVSVCR